MKKALAVAGLALSALAARRYWRMRSTLARVAPELRSPLLPYISVPYTERALPLIRLVYRIKTPAGRGVTVRTRHVDRSAIRVLVTTPAERQGKLPAILQLHAGGMIVGSPELELGYAGDYARRVGAVVVSPAYRLAPENPFPAGLDDCMATLRWMREHADELGIDSERIAVMGASAGGGLAAAVAQRSHDEGITLRAQALVYPMLDDRTVLRDDHEGRGDFFWIPASNTFAWTAYLGREPRMSDAPEYAAPARRDDLSGLPPAWIGVGDLDLFYAESLAYAGRLTACGVPCELVTVPRMYHAADGLAPKAQAIQDFRASMIDHLRAHLQPSG